MTAIEPIAVEDFPFEWGDPTDAGKTWEWDDMHFPSCLTPLGGDYARMIVEGDAYGSDKLDIPFEFRGQVFNGYVYYVSRHDVPDDQLPAARERAAAMFREQIPLAAGYWRKSLVELPELYAWMASVPVEDAPLADLANAFEVVRSMYLVPITRNTVLRLGLITIIPLLPLVFTMIPLDQIIDRAIDVFI